MPVEDLPHWTILPNWRTPVMERLECLTAVLASPSGAEQRFAARWSPRRYLEPLVTPVGRVRTLFDMAVGAVGVSPWYVPLWHDVQSLTETLGIADTVLNCETEHREFVAGGFVMLWRDEFTSEVLEVASVGLTSLTFVAGPAASWPAGTRLFPAVKARLAEMPSMGRRSSRVLENSIRFMVETHNDFVDPDVTLSYPTYESLPVLVTSPDESQDITHARMRLLEDLDSETGLSRVYDTAGIDFTLQRHHWLSVGRQEHAELRTLFYTLDGRRGLLWLPTFAADLEVVDPIDSTDTAIVVGKCGFTAFGGPRFGRDRIWIRTRSGVDIFREITGSTLGSDTETIQLDSAVGEDLEPQDVLRVSFMALSRLDSDTLEIEHFTDTEGGSRVAMNFRSLPDIRSAADWTPTPLPNSATTEGECGTETICTPAVTSTGAAFSITDSVPSGSDSVSFPTILPVSSDFYVSYLNGTADTARFRYVDISDNVSAETVVSVTTCDLIGVVSTALLPTASVFNSGASEARFNVSDNGSVYEFDTSTFALDDTRTISNGHTIVAMDGSGGATYRVVMVDPGNEITFATWDVGDSPTNGSLVVTGNVGVIDAKPLLNTFATWAAVWRDEDDDRLKVNTISFFDSTVYGPFAVSASAGTDERHIDTLYCAVPAKLVVAWRHFSGTSPNGSVRIRQFALDLTTAETEVSIYNLAPLSVSGYTHLANREPVCGAVLPNQNVLLVERRYETVGAQLRAYEVLTLHAPGEAASQSNVVRLTPVGVGPTGDVRRSAAIKTLSVSEFSAEIVVVFESPVDNTGATELQAQRFTVTVCSAMSEPE